MGLLDKKVAIVTGAAQGIGATIAERFAEEGANIAVVDINLEKALETAAIARDKGVTAEAFNINVSDTAGVKQGVTEIIGRFGRVDILVNNAGITRDGLLMTMSEQDWDLVIAVNLKSVFNYTKVVSRQMIKQKAGAIVNVSSVVGLMGNPGQINYSASKAGVIGATKSSAKELAARNIRVNAVAPGFTATEILVTMPERILDGMRDRTPLGRLGDPRDIANAYLFLASDEASFVTGVVLRVDGGIVVGT